jgi:hypothetical protein
VDDAIGQLADKQKEEANVLFRHGKFGKAKDLYEATLHDAAPMFCVKKWLVDTSRELHASESMDDQLFMWEEEGLDATVSALTEGFVEWRGHWKHVAASYNSGGGLDSSELWALPPREDLYLFGDMRFMYWMTAAQAARWAVLLTNIAFCCIKLADPEHALFFSFSVLVMDLHGKKVEPRLRKKCWQRAALAFAALQILEGRQAEDAIERAEAVLASVAAEGKATGESHTHVLQWRRNCQDGLEMLVNLDKQGVAGKKCRRRVIAAARWATGADLALEFLLAAQNQWVPQFGAESEEVRAFELKVDKLVAEEGAEVCTLAHEAAERYRV